MTSLHTAALPDWLLPLVGIVLGGLAYGVGVRRLTRRGDAWGVGRRLAAGAGLVALAAATTLPLWAGETFRGHVVQHLLLSGLEPALLALSAPVTLALRTLPRRSRTVLLKLLHSRLVRGLTHPAAVVALVVLPLFGWYLTGAYVLARQHALLHAAGHLHMLAAGFLYAAFLLGIDPMVRRPSLVTRLLVLAVVAGSHDVLAKLMYAWVRPVGAGTAAEIRSGAQLMFYGGEAVELALAVILLSRWYVRASRRPENRPRVASPPGNVRRVAPRSGTSGSLIRDRAR